MKYLIIGLGNIGAEYENTRHNIGFMILDQLAKEEGLSFQIDKLAFKTEYKYKGRTLILIKPTTFMNLSGKAMNYWMQQQKIPKENVLVLVDDLALPLGKIRIRAKGSAAGHNGLKNIEQLTGGSNYARLRFGISDDFHKGNQIDYVLGKFNSEEESFLPELIDHSIKAIQAFSTIGISRTMNTFNK